MAISKLEHLSEADKQKLFQYVRAGNFLEVACAAIGITSRTLRNWRQHAASDPPIEPYASFIEQLEQVEALGEVEDIATVAQSGRGRRFPKMEKGKKKADLPPDWETPPDWKASAWLRSRRSPKRWGDAIRNEHTGPDGQPLDLGAAKVIVMPPKEPE